MIHHCKIAASTVVIVRFKGSVDRCDRLKEKSRMWPEKVNSEKVHQRTDDEKRSPGCGQRKSTLRKSISVLMMKREVPDVARESQL